MPMHTQILENLHALLDFNHVSRNLCERSKYFADMFGIPLNESESLLEGVQVPNRKLLREIADKFEVDPRWLLEKLMIPYFDLPLSLDDFNPDPIAQFELWYQQIKENDEMEPSAMALATLNAEQQLSNRMVLLKGVDRHGFTFFTHYNSPKGQDLDVNPVAALVFWWPKSHRQVRIEGTISKVSDKESDHYFESRGRDKQIAALASVQSEPIPNREYLLQKVEQLEEQYSSGSKIPAPASWGGYRVHPTRIEFWQGRLHRLHDRFLYVLEDKHWVIQQLAP